MPDQKRADQGRLDCVRLLHTSRRSFDVREAMVQLTHLFALIGFLKCGLLNDLMNKIRCCIGGRFGSAVRICPSCRRHDKNLLEDNWMVSSTGWRGYVMRDENQSEVFNCVSCKQESPTAEAHELLTTYCVSCAFKLRGRPQSLGESVCRLCFLEMQWLDTTCSGCGNPMTAMHNR